MNTLYLLMVVAGCLISLGLVAGLYSRRIGVSHLLVFLVVGMLAGVDGPLGLPFADYQLAAAVGNVALAIILLDGGLRTPRASIRIGLVPAGLLATVGVLLTAAVAGAAACWALDLDWRNGLLLGAVIGSTDAAAVFAQLSQSGVGLRARAECHDRSGVRAQRSDRHVPDAGHDPAHPDARRHSRRHRRTAARQIGWGLGVGAGIGFAVAHGLLRLPIEPDHDGLCALLLATAGLTVFAIVGLLDGSGFLAVYVFGLIVGNRARRVVKPALTALNGYTWLAQAGLFLLLGLLVTPHELLYTAGPALVVALVLMLVARPLAVVALPCTAALRLARAVVRIVGRPAWCGADRAGRLPGAGRTAGLAALLRRGVRRRADLAAAAGTVDGMARRPAEAHRRAAAAPAPRRSTRPERL